MLAIQSALRVLAIGSLALGLSASPALAANQLYQGSWVAESFGNDNVGGTLESEFFEVTAIPLGNLCNPDFPRCNFASTPVSATGGNFSALGTVCTPITVWASARPAKGATATTGMGALLPQAPRYRNPAFFEAGGTPKVTECNANTTIGGALATSPLTDPNDPLRGVAMKGAPVSGGGVATTTALGKGGGFTIPVAIPTPGVPCTAGNAGACGGMHQTTVGEFGGNLFPYLYSYTYATLRNDAGQFFAGGGPGDFSIPFKQGGTVAKAVVKAGGNQFGGVMKMLGSVTNKACYFINQGCSLGGMNWRYEAIGTAAYTSGGVVTAGYLAQYTGMYYNTALMQASTVMLEGERFPWTTGSVTVTATGRGPHKTIERRKGYDNRTAGGKGAVQLVTPVITRWLQPATNFETGGVGVLRFEFVPEPGKWMLLVAGLSSLAVVYRARRR